MRCLNEHTQSGQFTKTMKSIFIFIFYFSIQIAYAQNNDRVSLIDNTHGDNFYEIIIDNHAPTTMYLHFDKPEIPNFGSIYDRFSKVSGWYVNDKGEKVTLLGVLWAQDNLTLYAPKQEAKHGKYSLVADGYDSINLYEDENIAVISEKFNLSKSDGEWTKDGVTKRVQGVNFYEKNLERSILLKIQNEVRDLDIINIQDLILKELETSKDALVGMNGWAETEITLLEFTSKDDGLNVLLEITELGSCNTDRRSIMYVTINEYSVIEDFGIYEIENCKRYYPNKEGDVVRIIPFVDNTNYSDSSADLGSYKIVDSKIEIIKPWK